MLASCDGLLNAGLEHLKGMKVRVLSRAAPGRVARNHLSLTAEPFQEEAGRIPLGELRRHGNSVATDL
jgi:hypothetical protein